MQLFKTYFVILHINMCYIYS